MFALSTETTCPRRDGVPARSNAELGDALDLLDGVDAGVVRDAVAAAAVAEVDPARQLAHDQQVRAARPAPRRSGLASASAGTTRTGRRFANSSSPLRRPSRPCSGRGASGSVVSHFGPPTAPSSTASAPRQRSSTSGSSGVPCSSIDDAADRQLLHLEAGVEPLGQRVQQLQRAAPTTSGPMPSPGQGDDV